MRGGCTPRWLGGSPRRPSAPWSGMPRRLTPTLEVNVAGSLVYHNAIIYELVMILLYGRHYVARYKTVADLIPEGSSVLDICCGPGVLFDRYLRARSVEYTGVDVNPLFIERV